MTKLNDMCRNCGISRSEYEKVKEYIDNCSLNKVDDTDFGLAIFENDVSNILGRKIHYNIAQSILKWCTCEAFYPLNARYAKLFKKLYMEMPKYKNDILLAQYIEDILNGKDVPYKGVD